MAVCLYGHGWVSSVVWVWTFGSVDMVSMWMWLCGGDTGLFFQGKRNLSSSQVPSSSSRNSKGNDIKNMMANAIKGEGTARERLRSRKVLSQQPQGKGLSIYR